MTAAILIPARMDSTRFPGKPLAMLDGKPLIQHCYDNAMDSRRADHVCVVTDSADIAAYCEEHGMPRCFDRNIYDCGSDRLSWSLPLSMFERRAGSPDTVVNLQVDEPDVTGRYLDHLIDVSEALGVVVTACCDMPSTAAHNDPNTVKVAMDEKDRASYFTRLPLAGAAAHVGVYAYPFGVLESFKNWKQPNIEKEESLEQLRLLYYGQQIRVVHLPGDFRSINVPEDIK